MIQRFQRWWYPMMVTSITDQDEWGYGTVTITPPQETLPGRVRGWKYRKGTKYPTTVHIGTEDENGNFVELSTWEIGACSCSSEICFDECPVCSQLDGEKPCPRMPVACDECGERGEHEADCETGATLKHQEETYPPECPRCGTADHTYLDHGWLTCSRCSWAWQR